VKRINRKQLENTARTVALNAYAPYSKFRVGAALITASGKIFIGANVENASYGLCLCAERSAFSSAIASGESKILAICVACIDALPAATLEKKTPCGACRQWIQELAPEAEIIIAGEKRTFKIKDLLPFAFSLKKLAKRTGLQRRT
jgi:cytidine deaminase